MINIRLAVHFAHANRPEVLHCFGSLKGTAPFLYDVIFMGVNLLIVFWFRVSWSVWLSDCEQKGPHWFPKHDFAVIFTSCFIEQPNSLIGKTRQTPAFSCCCLIFSASFENSLRKYEVINRAGMLMPACASEVDGASLAPGTVDPCGFLED